MKLLPLSSLGRRIGLVAHITVSVGWLGTVIGFLILSWVGRSSKDATTVQSVYIAMNEIGRFAIVPLSFATLATGLFMALGTEWGLFRYWWILTKLGLTVLAAALLMLHQFTAVAGAARQARATLPGHFPRLDGLATQLVLDAGLGALVLTGITALSVLKPWGLVSNSPQRRRTFVVASIAALLAVAVVYHLTGHQSHLHG